MTISHESRTGRAGEYLVACDLEISGYVCTIASEGLSYDLLADAGDGNMITIQVKTKTFAYKDSYKYKLKKTQHKDYKGVDLFAFVALDTKQVYYMNAADAPGWTCCISAAMFAQSDSLALALGVSTGRGEGSNVLKLARGIGAGQSLP